MFNLFSSKLSQALSRKEVKDLLDKEEAAIVASHSNKLNKLIGESNEELKREREERKKLKDAYLKEASLRKYKKGMESRVNSRSNTIVLQQVAGYALDVLFRKTDDPVFFKYQSKLWRHIQWVMLT